MLSSVHETNILYNEEEQYCKKLKVHMPQTIDYHFPLIQLATNFGQYTEILDIGSGQKHDLP